MKSRSSKNILLDSNILIYAINKDSPKCQKAQSFIIEYQNKLVVSHQNILESFRILTHSKFSNPMKSRNALDAINRIVDKISIIGPSIETYYITRELIYKNNLEGNRIFDAYIVATILSNKVFIIATDNEKHFKIFEKISVYNPFNSTQP